jgi:signal transduction histidine kinase
MLSSVDTYLSAPSPGAPQSASNTSVYRQAVGSAISAWAASENELNRLLQSRIDGLVGRMRGSLALTGALSALSILLAVMTHWHLVRPLRRLENVASSVRKSKDYGLRINYESKDEIGSLASAFDNMLSELAAAHERERTEQTELARASRLTTMGAMTASIAHEINQPLAAIVANSNAAQRWLSLTPPDVEEVRAALKNIVKDGHRASDVISSVRAVFKKDSREKCQTAVNEIIEDVLSLVRGELRKQHVLVSADLLPGLPDVIADRTQLQQVIMNLIVNGIEAMAPVTDRGRVLIVRSGAQDSSNILITIEDSGAGFQPQDKDRIFDAFFTTKSQGMGMGLFICRSIIEAHGGRIWAQPGTDHGTVFHITLPSAPQ